MPADNGGGASGSEIRAPSISGCNKCGGGRSLLARRRWRKGSTTCRGQGENVRDGQVNRNAEGVAPEQGEQVAGVEVSGRLPIQWSYVYRICTCITLNVRNTKRFSA